MADLDDTPRENLWDQFQSMEAKAQQGRADAVQAKVEMAEAVLALFETREGKMVLAWLKARTLERAVTPRLDQHHLLVTAEQLMPYTIFREGQNSIVADILALMKAAKDRQEKLR